MKEYVKSKASVKYKIDEVLNGMHFVGSVALIGECNAMADYTAEHITVDPYFSSPAEFEVDEQTIELDYDSLEFDWTDYFYVDSNVEPEEEVLEEVENRILKNQNYESDLKYNCNDWETMD